MHQYTCEHVPEHHLRNEAQDSNYDRSEELKDAAYTLPRSMMWATTINGVMGLITAITTAYCLGDVASRETCQKKSTAWSR